MVADSPIERVARSLYGYIRDRDPDPGVRTFAINNVIWMAVREGFSPDDLAGYDDDALRDFFSSMETIREKSVGVEDLKIDEHVARSLLGKQWRLIRFRVLRALFK